MFPVENLLAKLVPTRGMGGQCICQEKNVLGLIFLQISHLRKHASRYIFSYLNRVGCLESGNIGIMMAAYCMA